MSTKPTKLEAYTNTKNLQMAFYNFIEEAKKVSYDERNGYLERMESACSVLEDEVERLASAFETYKPKKEFVITVPYVECYFSDRSHPEKLSLSEKRELFKTKNKFFSLLYDLLPETSVENVMKAENDITDLLYWLQSC